MGRRSEGPTGPAYIVCLRCPVEWLAQSESADHIPQAYALSLSAAISERGAVGLEALSIVQLHMYMS